MKFAFVFPGQGSQSVGMLSDLATTYPIIEETFVEASDILAYDLWQLSQEGPKENLDQTDKTQPALLAAGVAVWRLWQQQGGKLPILMAGHSFGEYSALVAANALEFKDAISLAQDRGRFMQMAVPQGEGAMAAILGLDDNIVLEICNKVSQGQAISAVNFNSPGQVVIAGHTSAVKRATVSAKEAGAKRAILLPVSVPAHSELMKPAAEKMAERLVEVKIKSPNIPVIHNVDVSTRENPDDIRAALVAQLYNPVPWVKTIEKMNQADAMAIFECGPGKVLTGLNKRINRQIIAKPIMNVETLQQALETTA